MIIFQYDGHPTSCPVRCAVHPDMGLMWATADVVKSLGKAPTAAQNVAHYAPKLAVVVPNPDAPSRGLRFMPHAVVMQWLRNRREGHEAHTRFAMWAEARKFPKIAAPEGLPGTRVKLKAALAAAENNEPDEVVFERQQRERFHYTAYIADKPVRVLYRNGEPWLSWRDVVPFLSSHWGLTGKTQIRRIQAFFGDSGDQFLRTRARNGDHVVVLRPTIFVTLMGILDRRAHHDLTSADSGVTRVQLWHRYAADHLADSGHRREITPSSLRERVFKPGANAAEKTPEAAAEFAQSQFSTYDEMLKSIKPE